MDDGSPISVNAAGHFHYRRSWITERPVPPDHLMIWVMKGTMDVTVADTLTMASPGDLVLLSPGAPHHYRSTSDDWEWLWLHCSGRSVAEWWSQLCPDGQSWPRLGADPVIRNRFVELATTATTAGLELRERSLGPDHGQSKPDPVTRLRVDSCAHSLLGLVIARLQARPAQGEPGVPDLAAWILDHLAEPLTVQTLAVETGWSVPHLHRLVRDQLGTTPMRLVTRLRIDRAERLLRDTDLTIAQIAALVGFPDPLHFSRRFRAVTGRPPSAVRQ